MIPQSEYDKNFFDGNHPAGYSKYARSILIDADSPYQGADAHYVAHKLLYTQLESKFPQGGKVLDIGCAKGFLVQDFRLFGFDCWGLDWSEYAISMASSDVKEFLIQSDAYEYLKDLPKLSYDVTICNRFLPCNTDEYNAALKIELERISKFQIYVVDDKAYYAKRNISEPTLYYNVKPIEQWNEDFKTETSHVESILDEKWDGIR